MIRFFVVLVAMSFFIACNNSPNTANTDEHKHDGQEQAHDHSHGAGDGVHFGLTKINEEGAIQASDLVAKLEKKEGLSEIALGEDKKVQGLHAKVEGTITEVCQQAGCWFRMKTAEGKEIFIKMKEHKSIPKDWSGKSVIAEGNAFVAVTSVDELKHYAEDKGKSKEEIAAIKEPKSEYQLIAEGVLLKK